MRDGWKNNVVTAKIAALHKTVKQCPSAEAAMALTRRLNEVRRRTDYILLTRLCFYESTLPCAALSAVRDHVKLMRRTNLIRNALQMHFFAKTHHQRTKRLPTPAIGVGRRCGNQ
jgi:hypothetical protein